MEERELEQTNISLAFVRCTDEDVGLSAFPLQRANVCVLDVASETGTGRATAGDVISV